MKIYDPEKTPLKGTMLLEASAGTGKTYALERMVTRLTGREKNPLEIHEILVVTFTERAAREMRERIRALLRERAGEKDRPPKERQRYHRAVSDFDRASIYTIHGFFRYVLRSWPFESGSPFQQSLDPSHPLEAGVLRDYLASLDLQGGDRESLRIFRDECRGGENMIPSLIQDLHDESIPPGAKISPDEEELARMRELADEFNRGEGPLPAAKKALLEDPWTDEDINETLQAGGVIKRKKNQASLKKIHAHRAACSQARSFGELMDALWGDPGGVKIGGHFLSLFEAAGPHAHGPGPLTPVLERFLAALGPLVDREDPHHRIDDRVRALTFRLQALRELRPLVDQRKDETGIWNYNDLIRRVGEAVAGERARPALVSVLQRRYKAALIDEFQDTDPRQWEIFEKIFANDDHLLVLIGDPKQSIYGFRGTDLRAYHQAGKKIPLENRYRLGTNYRSRESLVQAANLLFGAVFSEAGGGGYQLDFDPVDSGVQGLPRLSRPGGGAAVTFVALEGESVSELRRRWSESIAGEITSFLAPQSPVRWIWPEGRKRRVSPGDIAVLTERGEEEEAVLNLLRAQGVPAVRYRSLSVFSSSAPALLEMYLETLKNPRDPGSWRALLLGPLFRVSPALLENWEDKGRLDELTEYGILWRKFLEEGNLTRGVESLFALAPQWEHWAREGGAGPQETRRLSLPWPLRILSQPEGERVWVDFRHVLELLQEQQTRGQHSLDGLLSWLRGQMENGSGEGEDALRLEREDPAVKVMTMHAAKGLQFPLVFIHGGLKDGSRGAGGNFWRYGEGDSLVVDFLQRRRGKELHQAYDWEERKRLWYVAFTRGIEAVWLPRPRTKKFLAVEALFAAFDPRRSLGSGPLHSKSRDKEDLSLDKQKVDTLLEDLVSTCPDEFQLAESRPLPEPLPPPAGDEKLQLAPLPAGDLRERDPGSSSYSSLAARSSFGEDRGEKDRDSRTLTLIPPGDHSAGKTRIPLAQDRGAGFGTLAHALFEEIDFRLVQEQSLEAFGADREVEEFFKKICLSHSSPGWYPPRREALKAMVWRTLRAPVLEDLRLCDLAPQKRRVEAEFLLAVSRPVSLPQENGENLSLPEGYLKGFIDLFFQHQGRWWIADWKTNVPAGAEEAEAYENPLLEQMMRDHRYDLQYRLYLLALVCWLSRLREKAVDWDKEIGGALYLFIRGTREEDRRGIYRTKPAVEEMRPWFEALGCGEFLL